MVLLKDLAEGLLRDEGGTVLAVGHCEVTAVHVDVVLAYFTADGPGVIQLLSADIAVAPAMVCRLRPAMCHRGLDQGGGYAGAWRHHCLDALFVDYEVAHLAGEALTDDAP